MKPVLSAYIPFYHENLYYTQNAVPEAWGQLHHGEPGLLHDPMVQCTHGGFEWFTHLKHPQGDFGNVCPPQGSHSCRRPPIRRRSHRRSRRNLTS